MRKICVITGSRAEYGLLSRLMKLISEDADLQLQIIATNMHLSPEFGLTYKEIQAHGFKIDKKVQMLLSGDTANATAKSVGLGVIGFADAYEDLRSDLIVVLGDRYEILAAVTAALFYKIPVAHLHGGEITEGAYDDAIRHAITKMSHLHFTSTEAYRQRVIQMGEEPERVFNVGAIGIDNISHLKLLTRQELENSISFDLSGKVVLATYHPATLDNIPAEEQFRNLLDVLEQYKDVKVIFTQPNSDTGGSAINGMIAEFIGNNKQRAVAFASLGQLRYLSALQYVTAVIGNSSSGILEAPSFGIPTLDIGDRQKGRLAAESVLHCGVSKNDIQKGMERILSEQFTKACREVKNLYRKENTAKNILNTLKGFPLENIIQKSFYNL